MLALTIAWLLVLGSQAHASPVTVRRFYNTKSGSHFWSADGGECANVLASLGGTYAYDGPAWTLESSSVSDALYRAYNLKTGAHFYTVNFAEYISLGYPYVREGVAYYVSATEKYGYATVWRAYNTSTETHFYTSDLQEYLGLPGCYSKEGSAFWFPSTGQLINRTRRWASNSSSWPLCRVYVNYSQLPADWRDAAYRSRMQWNDAGASNLYFYNSSTSRNTITKTYPVFGFWLGATLTTPSPPATITSAQTQINGAFPWCSSGTPSGSQYDLESVITHELGHWVSEADDYNMNPSQSWPWATMHGQGSPGEVHMRTLAAEDIDGVRSLYGKKP